MTARRILLTAAILVAVLAFTKTDILLAAGSGPSSSITLSPSSPDGANGWYVSPVNVTISASDLTSGIKSINWRLDSGTWNSQTFSNTLNLAQNPSFEQISGSQINGWAFGGLASSTGIPDSTTAEFGAVSAKIISVENGWSGFNNQSNYIPVSPFSNMTASVWVKTQDVNGNGAYFKVYALSGSNPLLLTSSPSITASTSGFVRISQTFVVSANNAYGIYIDLGIFGTGTVWYDGVTVTNSSTDTQVNQIYSQNGQQTLEYYAVNNNNVSESPHNFVNFDIDTGVPTNWRNFDSEQKGNDHTLQSSISVDDTTAGIDSGSGAFQYSVDGGDTWGYYSNLTGCSSGWVSNGWYPTGTDLENGGHTAQLSTPAVDYCNSNWSTCKIIRFRASDLAGNSSSKDICIFGSYFDVSGDVGTLNSINMTQSGTTYNTDGIIIAAGTVSNFTSSNSWVVQNYSQGDIPTYSQLISQFPTSAPLPSGKLPTQSGLYFNNGSLYVNSQTIPANFSGSTFSAVIFVNGDLRLNSNYSLSPSSALVYIVSGNVEIDKSVTSISGVFISDQNINVSYNGSSGQAITINGSLLGDTLTLSRTVKKNSGASLTVNYDPTYLTKAAPLLGSGRISWQEVQ
ncbi:MAG: hypothetical protein M1352_00245 [Patescibacteria group bacterium]|nr:hypothetical protein [Patescibacteria group bacterium]